ncbi:SDR family NAD(P)-dependent oxidoreductase [Gemmatimonas sp.]|jgi:NAD(P)-dependent dehydrogenase (short-subunit alcohol dehydrogenase family)|uniref:SDR family NAD(P)-dependent oxidoreductase n=1 Tax=Gemmatimonas sp. TaxID=1962908 RepID=UPI0037C1853E
MSSDLSFSDQLIVITGVGREGQVGEGVARGFAQRGASLALIDLNEQDPQRTATLTSLGAAHVSAHTANLADAGDAQRVAAEVSWAHKDTHLGRVHAVVCVAGGFGMTGALDESDPEAWAKQFTINLETAFATTRAFLPSVRAAKGSFVYFGSVAATPGGSPKGMAAYAAAKSGVLSLMRTVALDEKAHGVRANAVAPTAIRTATNVADMGDKADYVERESVADVVAFLASPLARNVSGQVLVLA